MTGFSFTECNKFGNLVVPEKKAVQGTFLYARETIQKVK